MRMEDQGRQLRVYVDESAKCGGALVYEAVVRLCRDRGMAGATVLRGVQGYGTDLRIRKSGVLRLSSDLPMVIEIVDAGDKIDAILPEIEAVVGNGLITVRDVRMIRLRPDD